MLQRVRTMSHHMHHHLTPDSKRNTYLFFRRKSRFLRADCLGFTFIPTSGPTTHTRTRESGNA